MGYHCRIVPLGPVRAEGVVHGLRPALLTSESNALLGGKYGHAEWLLLCPLIRASPGPWLPADVLAVSNIYLSLQFFSNTRNFETEGDTPEKHGIKSLDPLEIYQFGLSFLVVSPSVSKLREFEKIRAVNTFETASTPAGTISSGGWFTGRALRLRKSAWAIDFPGLLIMS